MFTLNCKGKLISAAEPAVMGIINATPDSFYSGDLRRGREGILALAKKMAAEGADILDIGGQSTRPGSERISPRAEKERVLPVIEMIAEHLPDIIISIDTFQHAVAQAAIAAGASIVNDVSGGLADPEMIPAVAGRKVPYVCMHMKGSPENMQEHAHYEDIMKELMDYFTQRIEICNAAGITDIIIDPGFGFAKTPAHNFTILKNLALLKTIGTPVLAGLSRKSTIYRTLGITPAEALNGTTVLNTIALNNGADILRVHDVKEAKEAVTLMSRYRGD